MSQVTRCPSCGTRFKVVADQLRISQGWVRCGMCQGVFDASEDLQSIPDKLLSVETVSQDVTKHQTEPLVPDVENEESPVLVASSSISVNETSHPEPDVDVPVSSAADPEWVASEPLPLPVEDMAAESGSAVLPEVVPIHGRAPEDASSQSLGTVAADSELQSVGQTIERTETQEKLDVGNEATVTADVAAESLSEDARDTNPAEDRLGEERSSEENQQIESALNEPGFVRQARRKAFWHSTGMRVVLVLGSLLAVAGGAGQYVWQQKDALAAQYLALAPILAKACTLAGCELQARRNIADVVITGSGFKQLADPYRYQWTLTLENRSDVPVATPMAELTLTDAQDKPLLRRVIDLNLLGAPQKLQAREEWSVNVPVQLQDLGSAVAGYRTLVFYP